MILCIGATPAAQRVMVFRELVANEVNRAAICVDGIAGKSVNVAKVLHALGEQVVATGFLGGDRGREVSEALRLRGIQLEFVHTEAPTRQCITAIDKATGEITELVEESHPVPPVEYERLSEIVRTWAPRSSALIMSGTITPGGPQDFYQRCTELARESNALSVVDAKGPVLLEALKVRPGLVKPNRVELSATMERELKQDAEVLSAMRELHERGATRVVVTAGKGPTLAFDGRSAWQIHPPAISPVNPIGSGDAFTAGLVWRLARGDELGEACRWAAAAGAANALSLMAGEVERKDVDRLVKDVSVLRL